MTTMDQASAQISAVSLLIAAMLSHEPQRESILQAFQQVLNLLPETAGPNTEAKARAESIRKSGIDIVQTFRMLQGFSKKSP